MYGGQNPGGVSIGTTAATEIVDPSWNEIGAFNQSNQYFGRAQH